MVTLKISWPLKTGLLLVALSYFSFTFYEFIICIVRGVSQSSAMLLLTETAVSIGTGFRTVAGLIAVITILSYIINRGLSKPEAMMAIRWILILEAVYFAATFFPSAYSGILRLTVFGSSFSLINAISSTLPCLIESTLIPAVLIILSLKLAPEKSAQGAIKWGLIAGTSYILVFWLNNMGNWIGAVIQKGTEYIALYPVNLLSFVLTTVGLFVLVLYAAYFSKKSFGKESLADVGFSRIGLIVTALGLYFIVTYMLWIFFDSVGGWSMWYAWFLGHNVDLWVMALPLAGLPLLYERKKEMNDKS